MGQTDYRHAACLAAGRYTRQPGPSDGAKGVPAVKQAGQVGTDWTARPRCGGAVSGCAAVIRRQVWRRRGTIPDEQYERDLHRNHSIDPSMEGKHQIRIPRIGRDVRPCLARPTGPANPAQVIRAPASPSGQEPHLVSRLGGDSLVRRFIQHVAAGAHLVAERQARSRNHVLSVAHDNDAPPAAAHRPAVHPLSAKPGQVLDQPHQRPDGAPPMVPVLLPGPRPGLPSHQAVRYSIPSTAKFNNARA